MTGRSLTLAVLCAAFPLLHPASGRAASAGPFVPPPPLRIGVGGDYADGLDGMLIERGLPHERIFSWELADPDVLRRFDYLLLSCPIPEPGIDGALEAWVRAGGRAYVEVPRTRTGAVVLPQLISIAGATPQESDAVIGDPAFAAASGLPAGTPIDLYDLVGAFLRPQSGYEGRTLARFCPDKGGDLLPGGDALLAMTLGEGELIFSGPPLAFCCFRGAATEPLLGAAISYLLGDRGRPRLTTTEAEQEAPEAPGEVDTPAAAAPPDGFEAVNAMAATAYNVTATLGPAASGRGAASMLLLDGQAGAAGQALRPCLWLAFGAKHVQLRAGTSEAAAAIASLEGPPPTESVDLLVRRRPGLVSVVLGDRELLRAEVQEALGGLVAVKSELVPLADAYCQEVVEPVLFDNFMREPEDPSEWTPVSGEWTNIGVGNEQHSVNGFFLRGEGRETALTTMGDWFWEEYAVSAAVRPESATACGLAALQQANGDGVAFLADTTSKPWPTLRLVRVTDGRETPLAQRTGGLAPEQWYRLALRVHEDRLEGVVDGELQLACPNPEPRGGGIGLLAQGGAARFDDVLVHSAAKPLVLPGGEGTPVPGIPPYVGAEDHLTWANPAVAWEAGAERPSVLWHQGDFRGHVSASLEVLPETEAAFRRLILAPGEASPEAEWLTATVRTTPGETQALLEVALPGAKPVSREAALGVGQTLRLARDGGTVRVSWGDAVVHEARSPGGLRRIALEVDGPP
ncbi:MAG: hypothetical protein FJX74_19875, partial [Armatimonadetes bacterium]|nr:hypothetical protein [Armatimonadota bacterium]